MPSNQTPNYALSQWERDDRILMDDFNADNAKIDAAIKAEADARATGNAALRAALAKKGNVRVEFYTYTGTGTSGSDSPPCRIPFTQGEPFLILVLGDGNRDLLLHKGLTNTNNRTSSIGVSWTDSSVSWHSHGDVYDQLNVQGWSYTALKFYKLY